MPTRRDLAEAAQSLRAIATHPWPDSSPADTRLQERLELAASILEAAARS